MFLPNHPTTGDETTWPYITRVGDRQQTDNWTWSSSSPYTSFYTYGGAGKSDAEFGVYNAIGLVALEQSIDILQKIGVENICTHINSYFDQIESQLLNWGFDSQRCNTGKSTILSLKPPSHIDSPQLPEILKNKGISCSYPDGFLRLAPHWCNPIEETHQLLQIIEDLV